MAAYEMRISDWSSDVCSSDLLIFWRLVRKTYGYTGKFSEDRRAALSSRAGCRAVCERTAACRHHARWPNRVCRASAARRYTNEEAAGAYRVLAGWSHHLRGRSAAHGHAHSNATRPRCGRSGPRGIAVTTQTTEEI